MFQCASNVLEASRAFERAGNWQEMISMLHQIPADKEEIAQASLRVAHV